MSKRASTKLDLLKRYGNASSSSWDGNKKRRKKKPVAYGGHGGSDDEDLRPSARAVNKAWEDVDGEDEAPVVVDEQGQVVAAPKGSWSTKMAGGGAAENKNGSRRDASPPLRPRNDSPSPPRRRPRNDSPSPPRRPRNDSPSPPRRPRNDSPSPPRRHRNDRLRDDSPSPSRRKRSDSSSPPRRLRERHDSASGSDAGGGGGSGSGSESEGGASRPAAKRVKTASGHTAGLMSAAQFAAEDRRIKEANLAAVATAAAASGVKTGAEQAEETVYRDKKGRKLDMLNEFMRQQAIHEGKAVKEQEEAYEWGKGTAQKRQEAQFQEELANIANEPFARTKNDPAIDAEYRNAIHADDPMAEYVTRKREKRQTDAAAAAARASGKPLSKAKPKYKGPAPRPNRFGILPGYRWDGRDRGSAWEERVFGQAASKQRSKDASYQWSVSDM
jgi:pre-mRNA-splicing factor CWC26